ncbi:MAG: porphobilinogen synthase [Methanocellales archaeon]
MRIMKIPGFPSVRMRRLRKPKVRKMIRETKLALEDLIYPIFIDERANKAMPINSMPGQFRIPLNTLKNEVEEIIKLGIPAVILFGIPKRKDELGSEAYNNRGIVQTATRLIKKDFEDEILIITDLCLCGYTSHGHCGLVDEKTKEILNDSTLEILGKIAVSQAEAGADVIAPSGMMDGMVQAIRIALDDAGFKDTLIMSYAAKYQSNFYTPFREAAESSYAFGDRSTYQMDFANSDEALREVALDLAEGADIVMVKPALAYLDIIYRVKQEFKVPVAAYNVSGEYSMIKAVGEKGWLNEQAIMLEVLTAIKRAGADMILTYFAKEMARILRTREKA